MASRGVYGLGKDKDDYEVDDFTFLKHPKQGSSGYALSNTSNTFKYHGQEDDDDDDSNFRSESDRRRQLMIDEMEKIQKRTLESSARSLGLVHESEQIGVATAEELMLQREQLENCESKVNDVNRSLRQSQKHINSIKSIFGGFMNRFSKNQSDTLPTNVPSKKVLTDEPIDRKPMNSLLSSAVKETKSTPTYRAPSSDDHPSLRLRGVNYDSSQANDSKRFFDDTRETSTQIAQKLDSNLDDLGLGLSRLKGLAIGLGDEIEEQNSLLERIGNSVDRADLGIQRQNKQMDKILKK